MYFYYVWVEIVGNIGTWFRTKKVMELLCIITYIYECLKQARMEREYLPKMITQPNIINEIIIRLWIFFCCICYSLAYCSRWEFMTRCSTSILISFVFSSWKYLYVYISTITRTCRHTQISTDELLDWIFLRYRNEIIHFCLIFVDFLNRQYCVQYPIYN